MAVSAPQIMIVEIVIRYDRLRILEKEAGYEKMEKDTQTRQPGKPLRMSVSFPGTSKISFGL